MAEFLNRISSHSLFRMLNTTVAVTQKPHHTKYVHRNELHQPMDNESWRTLLIQIDLQLAPLHEHCDIMIISSPYDKQQLVDSIHSMPIPWHICTIIKDYLLVTDRRTELQISALHDTKQQHIVSLVQSNQFSLIIVDMPSSQIFKLPRNAQDLSTANSEINNRYIDDSTASHSICKQWTMRWSLVRTSAHFRSALDAVCQCIASSPCIKYFVIDSYGTDKSDDMKVLMHSMKKLTETEHALHEKIAHSLNIAMLFLSENQEACCWVQLTKTIVLKKQLQIVEQEMATLDGMMLKLKQSEMQCNVLSVEESEIGRDFVEMIGQSACRKCNEEHEKHIDYDISESELEAEMESLRRLISLQEKTRHFVTC